MSQSDPKSMKALAFALSIGAELTASIGVGLALGYLAHRFLGAERYWLGITGGLGLVIGLYRAYRIAERT